MQAGQGSVFGVRSWGLSLGLWGERFRLYRVCGSRERFGVWSVYVGL